MNNLVNIAISVFIAPLIVLLVFAVLITANGILFRFPDRSVSPYRILDSVYPNRRAIVLAQRYGFLGSIAWRWDCVRNVWVRSKVEWFEQTLKVLASASRFGLLILLSILVPFVATLAAAVVVDLAGGVYFSFSPSLIAFLGIVAGIIWGPVMWAYQLSFVSNPISKSPHEMLPRLNILSDLISLRERTIAAEEAFRHHFTKVTGIMAYSIVSVAYVANMDSYSSISFAIALLGVIAAVVAVRVLVPAISRRGAISAALAGLCHIANPSKSFMKTWGPFMNGRYFPVELRRRAISSLAASLRDAASVFDSRMPRELAHPSGTLLLGSARRLESYLEGISSIEHRVPSEIEAMLEYTAAVLAGTSRIEVYEKLNEMVHAFDVDGQPDPDLRPGSGGNEIDVVGRLMDRIEHGNRLAKGIRLAIATVATAAIGIIGKFGLEWQWVQHHIRGLD